MPKLPVLSPKAIAKILVKEGFELNRIKGSHHIFVRKSDKRIAVVPFHQKDLPKGTLLAILRQAGLTRDEINDILRKK